MFLGLFKAEKMKVKVFVAEMKKFTYLYCFLIFSRAVVNS